MSDSFKATLFVGVGSAIGGMGRYWVVGLFSQRLTQLPVGTLLVNVSGSFFIGLLAAFTVPEGRMVLPRFFPEFLMIGVLGGYTTFSSFSLQTLALAREGLWLQAAANVAGSVILCLAAVWAGYWCGEVFNR